MSNETEDTSYMITFCAVLVFFLSVLKITGLADISWWLVTLPIWGGIGLCVAVVILIFFGAWAVGLYLGIRRKMGRRNRNG